MVSDKKPKKEKKFTHSVMSLIEKAKHLEGTELPTSGSLVVHFTTELQHLSLMLRLRPSYSTCHYSSGRAGLI